MNILNDAQTICPECHRPLPGHYVARQEDVYFIKTCPEHGTFETFIGAREDYEAWMSHPVVNIPPLKPITGGKEGECPLHCGTCENHLQTACCVLIDITQRCNQHCPYCFASAGVDTEGEPTLEEIEEKYDLLLELGEEREFNLQISGGEPTVRDDLIEITALARDKGFRYIQLNTNGKRIAEEEGYAEKLREAGTSVVFLQFDGTTDEIYEKLRNEPLLETKKKAVENCRKAGLAVTLVPTVVKGVNLDNIGAMTEYLLDNVDVVKGIHFQPVSYFGRTPEDGEGRVTMFDVLHALEEQTENFHYDDFCPIATGHQLCCFYSTYTKTGDGVKCNLSKKEKEEGVSCCESSCCGPVPGEAEALEIIAKDRDYVWNKWEMAPPVEENCCCGPAETEVVEESCCCSSIEAETGSTEEGCCCGSAETETENDIMDLDAFLQYYKRNTFTLTGMAFQDISNLDAERLKRCRVVQLTDDNRLIPFCAYNSMYRKGGEDA